MNILHALILGIVEGLTEFLPISSTFHLLFVSRLLGLQTTSFNTFFDIFVQSAAILPVLLLYGRSWFQDKQVLTKVLVAFLPTAAVGFVLHKVIKEVLFNNTSAMLIAFMVVGLLFFVVEWLVRQGKLKLEKSLTDLTYTEAALIGLWQATAVLPGVSRAGAVIVGLLLMGYRRDEAGRFSFMLAVPTILAASALDFLKSRGELNVLSAEQLLPLAVGCAAAFVSSLLIIRWFISYLRGHSLEGFGWYRLLAGAVFFALAR